MSLPRLYYTLPELAEKWKRSENDLLHMAATGALELSINHIGSAVTWDNESCTTGRAGGLNSEPLKAVENLGPPKGGGLFK